MYMQLNINGNSFNYIVKDVQYLINNLYQNTSCELYRRAAMWL